ncbi:hypothetical protein bcgnr5380_59480 [Bacillus cereus]
MFGRACVSDSVAALAATDGLGELVMGIRVRFVGVLALARPQQGANVESGSGHNAERSQERPAAATPL